MVKSNWNVLILFPSKCIQKLFTTQMLEYELNTQINCFQNSHEFTSNIVLKCKHLFIVKGYVH